MPLDVLIQPKANTPPRSGNYEYVCSFADDEGDYWFLYPLFEKLRGETGLYIDLYDDAVFGGDALDALARTLSEAHELVAAQPERWEVVTGVQTYPVQKVLRATVNRRQVEMLVDNMSEAVSKAKTSGAYVRFAGD